MKKGTWKIAIKAIEEHQNIIIFHHTRPDGDCLGSQNGLAELIRVNYPNKKVYVVGDNHKIFEWMNYKFDEPSQIDFNNSLAVIVDASSTDRIELGELMRSGNFTNRLRIDHHPNGSDIEYDYLWVDEFYSAAAEMIAQIAYRAKWIINNKAASHIYLGMLTDSGRFMYASTQPRTHILAAHLMEKGELDIQSIHQNLYKSSMIDLEIKGQILSNFKKDGNVLYYVASVETQEKLGVSPETIANHVNELANIEDNRIWIFFVEYPGGTYRVRLRSNGPKVNTIARKFNGGGHDQASGANIESAKDIKTIVKLANKLIEKENK